VSGGVTNSDSDSVFAEAILNGWQLRFNFFECLSPTRMREYTISFDQRLFQTVWVSM
jgi:hypothetical protein